MTTAPTLRTSVRIATFRQPDGTMQANHTIELKGIVHDAEAVTRAKHIIRAQPRLDHTERGYLLNCLEIGNYELVTE